MKYNFGQEFNNIEANKDKLNETKELLKLEIEWKPKKGEIYWTVLYHLGAWGANSYEWESDRYDICAFKSGVVFKTEKQAQFEADKRNFLQQMELDFKSNSDLIDWKDTWQIKYSIRYWHDGDMIIMTKTDTLQFNNVITTNANWLEQYIIDNKENIEKYYFEVEK